MTRSADDGDLTLVNASVWAHPDHDLVRDATVEIRSGSVAEVAAGRAAEPRAARVVDLGGKVVTAGWWNCHVHFTEPRWRGARHAPAGELQRSLDDMLVSRGFTGAVDLGSDSRITLPLLSRIDSGELAGPRVLTATEAIYPHRGLPSYLRDTIPWFARWGVPTPVTPGGARRAAARQIRRGARVIKLFTGSYLAPGRIRPMGARHAAAAAEVAHEHGLPVFAHPSNREGVRIALDAGVDVLAHLPDSAKGTAELLVEAAGRGMRLVPTLDMFARTVSRDPQYLDAIDAGLRVFLGAGGRLLFGTDVGFMSAYDIGGELAALERCGVGAAAILHSLTTEPTSALGLADAGTVEPGRRADLTVLHSTDHPDPADFARVAMTVIGGRVVHDHAA